MTMDNGLNFPTARCHNTIDLDLLNTKDYFVKILFIEPFLNLCTNGNISTDLNARASLAAFSTNKNKIKEV